MNRTLLFSLLVTCLAFLPMATPAIAADAARGSVHGYVSNAATTAFLEGARVEAPAANAVGRTDRDGRFELSLPAGEHELVVSYLGLSPQTLRVNVPAGQQVKRDIQLTSEIYSLEKFTVDAVREGNAL